MRNGTFLSQRRKASQWMRVITFSVISGYLSESEASIGAFSGRRFPVSELTSFFFAINIVVDQDTERVSRDFKSEFEFQIEFGKRGDVIIFRGPQDEAGAGPIDGHDVGFEFAKCVADLHHRDERLPGRIKTKKDRNRIECVA